MKTARVHRLLKLITMLQAGTPLRADELAKDIQVSRRTLFRDLNMIRLAGIPLHYDPSEKRYGIEKSFFLPPTNFTLAEVLGVMLVLRNLAESTALPNPQPVMDAMIKLESTLPADIQEHLGSAMGAIACRLRPATDARRAESIFNQLWQACRKKSVVEIRYDSYFERNEIVTRVRPYRIVFMSRGWYLIGHSSMHKEVRTFKVDRMIKVREVGQTFTLRKPFDLGQYFGNAWQMIRGDRRHSVAIRFSPKVANNVEEVLWHPMQEIEHLDDGSIIYHVEVDGIDEIAWWVLGYGKEAVVEKPVELRRIIEDHIRAMHETYEL